MAQAPKSSVFIGQKSIFRLYCIQNFKDGIQIQAYNSNNECLIHFSQFIAEKVKKNLRKSQAQFREKLRKLRLRQNYGERVWRISYEKIRIHLHVFCVYQHQEQLLKFYSLQTSMVATLRGSPGQLAKVNVD